MPKQKSILFVDDDDQLRATLAEQLARDGEFIAVGAASLGEAESRLLAPDMRYDAVILDVGMPDGDGRDLCARLRRDGINVPVIILTGADDEADIVRGLDSGANDYIVKPFSFAELLARLRAIIRGFETSNDAVFPIGPYIFRPSDRMLREPRRNRCIRLTRKEAAVLSVLYRAGTEPVPRKVLLREVWGYNTAAKTRTVETHIYRLRQKLDPDRSNVQLLLTNGDGYRLDPDRATAQ
jgi:DNA-binding response OmpR family regulator